VDYTYNFEKLEIWKLAIELALGVYKLTKNFPKEEKYGITNQLRRASTSVSANIAEGMARSGKDRKRFLQISFSSSIEVMNFLILVYKLNYISEDEYNLMRNQTQELTNKINSFYKSLKD
jgi:four helix bundle protein